MKNWIVLIGLLLVACSDKAPVVAPLDTSTLEAPVAQSIDSARRAVQANTLDPNVWATYAEVLQAASCSMKRRRRGRSNEPRGPHLERPF